MAAAVVVTAGAGTARAQVVSTSGQVQETAAVPSSLAERGYESNEYVRLFFERELTLTTDVAADAVSPGSWSSSALTPPTGTVPAGTSVKVYLLHFDNVGTVTAATGSGSVEFGEDVLGLLFVCHPADGLCPSLDATDAELGAATIYPTGDQLRGVELFQTDQVSLSADRRTVDVSFTSTNRTDQVRILVAAPPEEDAGVATPDASVIADAAPPPPDSGPADSGAADTASGSDASSEAGTPPPGGSRFEGGGGCGCRAGGGEGAPTFLMLLVVGAIRRSRVRRRA